MKQEIKVFIYRALSDEYMSADEYALYMQDIGKGEFIKDMTPFELSAIDRGIYTAFDGKYKTGTEPTCYEGGDSDSEDEDRPDLKARQAKKKEEMRKQANAAREARLTARKN